jgi:glycerol-3-phosphate cytidylyltransferase
MKKEYIIGYTTGVFDMFHIGHLNILKTAKKNCDFLIVGVTTDELSLAQKGKNPIIPFNERFQIIQSIRYVDRAVEQTTMDKFEAWENLGFNVMFVGNDWKGSEKWNKLEADFKKVGVEIKYFPYTKHTSSTLLRSVLEKIETNKS